MIFWLITLLPLHTVICTLLPPDLIDKISMHAELCDLFSISIANTNFRNRLRPHVVDRYMDNQELIDGSVGLRLSLTKLYNLWLSSTPGARPKIESLLRTHHNFALLWGSLIQGQEFSCQCLLKGFSIEGFISWYKVKVDPCEGSKWISTFAGTIEPSIMALVLNHAKGITPSQSMVRAAINSKLRLSSFKILLAATAIDAAFFLSCDSNDIAYYPYLFELSAVLLKNRTTEPNILTNCIRYIDVLELCLKKLLSSLPINHHIQVDFNVLKLVLSKNDTDLFHLFCLKFPTSTLLIHACKLMSSESVFEMIMIHPEGFVANGDLIFALSEIFTDDQMCDILDHLYPDGTIPSGESMVVWMLTRRCSDKLVTKVLDLFPAMEISVKIFNKVVEAMDRNKTGWTYITLGSLSRLIRGAASTYSAFLSALPLDLDEDVFMTFAWSLPPFYRYLEILLEHRVSPVNIKTFARRAFGSKIEPETAMSILWAAEANGYDEELCSFLRQILNPRGL